MGLADIPNEVQDVTSRPSSAAPDGVIPEDLDQLAREADMLDAAPEAAAAAGALADVQSLNDQTALELFGTLQAVRAMAFPMLSVVLDPRQMIDLEAVWNDGVLERSAGAGAAIMVKHGWTLGAVMGEYAPYLMLIAALAPPVIATKRILDTPPEKPKPAPPGGQQQQA